MNAMETNLLVKADRMSESSLVSLGDWELAYLRMAMVNRVEDAVNESLQDTSVTHNPHTHSPHTHNPHTHSPHRQVGVQPLSAEQPCPSGQGYCGDDEVVLETKG